MKTTYLVFFAGLFLWAYSCSQTNKTTSSPDSLKINYSELSLEKGKTIVQSVCITCHDPKNSKTDRIAPPLELVKRNYLSVANNERDFIRMVSDFILVPSQEEARLHEEVDEFGLMDPLGYSKTDIQSVAMYLYRTELERPDWVGPKDDL